MNKFATVALLCVSACLVKAECEILDGSNFGEKVMDADKGILKGSTPWFIKFYAPWCGHCQRMSASWGEFADKHREAGDLNVGKVDCTGDKAKDICQDYDVRGYPTLLFFPSQGQQGKAGGSSYYKFKGARTPEAWEKYTLGGGYLEQEAESEIPKNVEGFEYYQRQAVRASKQVAEEIDMMFHQFGLDHIVPPKARYAIMIGLTCLPVLLLCVFFWFFPDDAEPFAPQEEQPKPKVEQAPAQKKKAEKID